MQDDDYEEMDPEIAAAYEQFLDEMMHNESCRHTWAAGRQHWLLITDSIDCWLTVCTDHPVCLNLIELELSKH